jgi:hypothetical protein
MHSERIESMALLFKTNTPQALLNDFKKKIDEGHVVTWSYDKDGDFTHTRQINGEIRRGCGRQSTSAA